MQGVCTAARTPSVYFHADVMTPMSGINGACDEVKDLIFNIKII